MVMRQMKKPGMSQCQVPYRQDRKGPEADAVATAVGGVVAVEVVVAAVDVAAGVAVDCDGAAGTVVAGAPEQDTSQTWDSRWELVGSWGKVEWVIVESRNLRQRHGILRSAVREHEDPGG